MVRACDGVSRRRRASLSAKPPLEPKTRGTRIEAQVIEGRPPSTVDVPANDGSTCRYCLAQWNQSGPSAQYTFLYNV